MNESCFLFLFFPLLAKKQVKATHMTEVNNRLLSGRKKKKKVFQDDPSVYRKKSIPSKFWNSIYRPAGGMSPGMAVLFRWSVNHFDPDWNVSPTLKVIAAQLCTYTHTIPKKITFEYPTLSCQQQQAKAVDVEACGGVCECADIHAEHDGWE